MDIKELSKAEGITEFQLNAVLGTLMGDASVSRPRSFTGKAEVDIQHGSRQEGYIMFKYEVFRGLATGQPRVCKNPGYGNLLLRLHLRATKTFGCLYSLTHPNGITQKTITKKYLSLIDHPIALALWFLDDGNIRQRSNNACISTQGFTEPEIDLLVAWLRDSWQIDAHKQKSVTTHGKHRHILVLSPAGRERLAVLIASLTPSCMLYKTTVRMKVCPACGRLMPTVPSVCCSDECSTALDACSAELFSKELPKIHALGKRENRKHWTVANMNRLSAYTMYSRGLISMDDMSRRMEQPPAPLDSIEQQNLSMLARANNIQQLVADAEHTDWRTQTWIPYVIVKGRGARKSRKTPMTAEQLAARKARSLETQRAWMARLRQDKEKYAQYLSRVRENYKARMAKKRAEAQSTTGTA